MLKVLFVCTGNTCRSPLAEHIMRKKAKEQDLEIETKSAGIFAAVGEDYSANTLEIIRDLVADEDELAKYELTSLRTTPELMDWADLILTMTEMHQHYLTNLYPEHTRKIMTLKEESIDITDPFGGDLRTYEEIAAEITEAIDQFLEKYLAEKE